MARTCKLAERFVQAATAQNASAELIDLTQLDLPLFTPRVQAAGAGPDLVALHDQLHANTALGDLRPGVQRLDSAVTHQCHCLALGERRRLPIPVQRAANRHGHLLRR